MEFNKIRWRSQWRPTRLRNSLWQALYAGAISCQVLGILAWPTMAIGWGTGYVSVASWIDEQPGTLPLPIVRAAPSSPPPAPPDSGGPRRSQGSGTR